MTTAATLKKLFEDKVSLRPGSGQRWLEVRLSGQGLGDEQAIQLGRYLDKLLEGDGTEITANVELAENSIGNVGMTAVLDALENAKTHCKIIKLYKNRLGDEAGVRLARFLIAQTSAVEEVHLSHNALTMKSLVALCMALGKHAAYPALGRTRFHVPCWLRVEHNNIARPLETCEALRRDGDVTICTAEDRNNCGPWKCQHSSRTPDGVPKVHLYTITSQKTAARPGQDTDAEIREEIRKWGGRASAAPSRPAARRSLSGPTSPRKAATGPAPAAKSGPPSANRGWGTPPAGVMAPPAAATREAPASRVQAAQLPPEQIQAPNQVSVQRPLAPKACPVVVEEDACAGYPKVPPTAPTALAAPTSLATRKDMMAHNMAVTAADSAGGPAPVPPAPRIGAPGPWTKPCGAEATRPSFLMDVTGRRRIAPAQLEGRPDEQAKQFVCQLCGFVVVKPIMTNCLHLFCDACFREYVQNKVLELKAKSIPLKFIPCPKDNCTDFLMRNQITLLDKVDNASGASAVLRRLRNNLRVKCVHHTDFWGEPFGAEASALKHRVTCSWEGDFSSYDDHVEKHCAVEACFVGGVAPDAPSKASSPTAAAKTSAAVASMPEIELAPEQVGTIRLVRYSYVPEEGDRSQVALKKDDLVRVYEVAESGWAAGVRVSVDTKEEIGTPGWFPSSYLAPENDEAA